MHPIAIFMGNCRYCLKILLTLIHQPIVNYFHKVSPKKYAHKIPKTLITPFLLHAFLYTCKNNFIQSWYLLNIQMTNLILF